MASIRQRTTPAGHRRWEVVYRGPDKRQRTKTFKRKADAQRYANTVEADLVATRLGRPSAGSPTVRRLGRAVECHHHAPQAEDPRELRLDSPEPPLPEFGDRPIGSIDHRRGPGVPRPGLTNDGKGAGTVRNVETCCDSSSSSPFATASSRQTRRGHQGPSQAEEGDGVPHRGPGAGACRGDRGPSSTPARRHPP